jgi:hypothetical protein
MSVPMPARKVEPPDGFESLADAARRRGVSERTLRRQIEAGIVPAEMFQRPQGSVWFVPLPEGNTAETRRRDGSAANDSESAKGGDQAAPPDPAVWLGTWSGVVERVLDDNKAQAERIGELEREVGRLSGIEATVAEQLKLIKGQAESLRAYDTKRGEWAEQANEQRRRAERAEAELERLKARSWWDRLRGR